MYKHSSPSSGYFLWPVCPVDIKGMSRRLMISLDSVFHRFLHLTLRPRATQARQQTHLEDPHLTIQPASHFRVHYRRSFFPMGQRRFRSQRQEDRRLGSLREDISDKKSSVEVGAIPSYTYISPLQSFFVSCSWDRSHLEVFIVLFT